MISVGNDGGAGGRGHDLPSVAVHVVRREHGDTDRRAHFLAGDQHVPAAEHGGGGQGVRGAGSRGVPGAAGARLFATRPSPHVRQPQRDPVQRAGPFFVPVRGGAAGLGQVLGPRALSLLGRLVGDGAGPGALPRLLLALPQGARRRRLPHQGPGDQGDADGVDDRGCYRTTARTQGWTRVSHFCHCR